MILKTKFFIMYSIFIGKSFLNSVNSIYLFLSCTTPISLVYLTAPHILVELEYAPGSLIFGDEFE